MFYQTHLLVKLVLKTSGQRTLRNSSATRIEHEIIVATQRQIGTFPCCDHVFVEQIVHVDFGTGQQLIDGLTSGREIDIAKSFSINDACGECIV